MTESEARRYLDKTNWYVLRQCVTGDPIPEEIELLREEAYKILEKGENK